MSIENTKRKELLGRKKKNSIDLDYKTCSKKISFCFIGNFKNLKKNSNSSPTKISFNKIFLNDINLKKSKIFSKGKLDPRFLGLKKSKKISNVINLKKWLNLYNNRNFVKHRFLCFLFGTLDEKYGSNFYIEKLKKIVSFEKKNLIISFLHLVIGDPLLAIWLIDEPQEILKIFQECCNDIIKDIFYPISEAKGLFYVQIFELPIFDRLKNLRNKKMNSLVKIQGVVVSKTDVYPHLKFFKLFCLKCFELQKTIYALKENKKIMFTSCFSCKANGPFQISWSHVEYSNFQTVFIQKLNTFTQIEHFPLIKEIILRNNLIDFVNLGEEIIVTGILKYHYNSNTNHFLNSRLFSVIIEANYIEKPKSLTHNFLFDTKEEKILNLIFKKKQVLECLLSSLLPSVFYNKDLKLAILIGLFGKQSGKLGSDLSIRNNINILIMGDPSTGKSQILRGLEKLLQKSFLITNQRNAKNKFNSSFIIKKQNNNNWNAEGSAFILADKGFCLIDGIENLNIKERLFLNKIMDYQFISLKKKENLEFIKARCSIIATTTSLYSNYQSDLSLINNSSLDEKFISKFDIHLLLKDVVDSSKDEMIGNLIIESHIKNHFSNLKKNDIQIQKKFFYPEYRDFDRPHFKKIISQNLFRKYIIYSRQCVKPVVSCYAHELISKIYILLRNEHFREDCVKPTLRHLEIILRLSIACARLHLRERAIKKDALKAISVFLRCFFNSQPFGFCKVLKYKFKEYIYPFELSFESLLNVLVNFFLQKLKIKTTIGFFKKKKFENKLKKLNVSKNFMKKFFQSKLFKKSGFKLSEDKRFIFYVS
ncbi:minichromosome maintenance component complex 2-like protein (nucleomorph) [Chroomonas mesostigmatica CCMP1168]|uniref:DNA replication licensing factor MCM2 n=1 Tax=Chroomonas mesostigmatica CCMP1168 TaxID=1195612 RepID=J7G6F7_9CRYP|nr:minichromosome maintenance component complex 2-like protein [Chroomonas mesostigmatica CCMP1168]